MNDFRIKITAFAVVLGLGGLGGYALSTQQASQATTAAEKPKTQVIRRTVHAKPKSGKAAGAAGDNNPAASTANSGYVSAPVSTGSSGGSSGAASPSPSGGHRPVHSGSSGGGGSKGGGGGGGEREHEHERDDD